MAKEHSSCRWRGSQQEGELSKAANHELNGMDSFSVAQTTAGNAGSSSSIQTRKHKPPVHRSAAECAQFPWENAVLWKSIKKVVIITCQQVHTL